MIIITLNTFTYLTVLLSLQYASCDGFIGGSIDTSYVDGVSITHGSPRKHVWTFAVGIVRDYKPACCICPCAQSRSSSKPSFVGNDFYCESGMNNPWQQNNDWSSERLWDGPCSSKSNCCNHDGMPFFVKNLGNLVTDPLEVRFCTNEGAGNENVGVKKMELFVH